MPNVCTRRARELAELKQRQDRLIVHSPAGGRLQAPRSVDRLGRLVSQGDLLAYVADGSDARVRVVANQEDAARIRESVDRIQVRPAGIGAGVFDGRLLQEVPAASDTLPSAVLGSRGWRCHPGGCTRRTGSDRRCTRCSPSISPCLSTLPHSMSAVARMCASSIHQSHCSPVGTTVPAAC